MDVGSTEMMIVMQESATTDEVDRILERLDSAGATGHVSTSDVVTVIGGHGGEGRHRRSSAGGLPRRGQGRAHPQALQAREPRVPALRHGHHRGGHQPRRRARGPHRRTLLGGDPGAAARGRRGRQERWAPPCCAAGLTSRGPRRTPSRAWGSRDWRCSPRPGRRPVCPSSPS